MEELEELQYRLALALELNIYCCLLSKTNEGCFKVTFLIPKYIQGSIFPLYVKQKQSLMELKVLKIVCGDYIQNFKIEKSEMVCITFNRFLHAIAYIRAKSKKVAILILPKFLLFWSVVPSPSS